MQGNDEEVNNVGAKLVNIGKKEPNLMELEIERATETLSFATAWRQRTRTRTEGRRFRR